MEAIPDPVVFPELIFGIAGPIGVDVGGIAAAITDSLKAVNYRAVTIKLTKEMLRIQIDVPPPGNESKFDEYSWKMDYANKLRKHFTKPDALARIAIDAIRSERLNEHIRSGTGGEGGDEQARS